MQLRNRFGAAAIALIPLLNGCGGPGNETRLTQATLTISPIPLGIAAGTTQTFTATTTNAGGAPVQWSFGGILGYSVLPPGGLGTFSASSGDTVTYTAPSTPPIFSGPDAEMQGGVEVTAMVEPTNGNLGNYETIEFAITAPGVSVSLQPKTVTVPVGRALPEQFDGYSVGSVDSALIWQVNGVTGGSTAYGTITQGTSWVQYGGSYTAPATMPMTGPTVTITMISHADPTKTATATVTLQ